MLSQPLRSLVHHHHHFVGGGLVSIVLLSLAAAGSYGLAAVLQHREARRQPPELSMRAELLINLARRPVWLAANALDGVGYLFQFLALRRGSLALVEPLLVLSLVLVLPVRAWIDRRRITAYEMVSIATIVVGIALFMGAARPGVGHPRASEVAWIVLSATIAASCAAVALASRYASRDHAAALLAAGSGTAFGYVAAVTEHTGHLLERGVLHTLSTWAPYALVVSAIAALLLTQSAFHAGPLRLSLPTLTIAQPLVAVAIGLGIFDEGIHTGGLLLMPEIVGLVLAVIGVYAATQSPVVAGPGPGPGPESEPGPRPGPESESEP